MRMLACLSMVVLQMAAVSHVPAQDVENDTTLIKRLTKLEQDSWDAVVANDKKFLESYLAKEAVWFLADGTSVDREGYLKDLTKIQVKKYKMGPTKLLRVSDNVAMIMYRVSYEAVVNGQKEIFADIESSSLYVQREGKWQEIFYQETSAQGVAHGTAVEAKQMVNRAIELFKKEGTAAFETITKGANGFRDRDLYVFVAEASKDGKVVAYGGSTNPSAQVGKRLLDVKSPSGEAIGQLTLNTATEQGAWIDYSYVDPVTKQVEHKFSWVVRTDKYIFGCGIYVPSR